jgi:hypothetical protein
MRQLTFKTVYGEFAERSVFPEEGIEEELVRQMVEAIAEVFKDERRVENEGSSEQ